MPRVLIADQLSDEATRLLQDAGYAVDIKPGRDEQSIVADIGEYDALIVRSATTVTPAIIEAGIRLKVIGRAGVGVDNIDLAAATEQGIIVMNAPLGNIVSAAEHTLAMILAMARDLPAASREMSQGTWNRKAHTGIELEGKVLGVVGLGKIGQHVARVCRAMGMTLLGFDPYISEQRAREIDVELVTLDDLLRRSDVITLHVPRTPETVNLIDAGALGKMKRTARLVNVARGGIVDEAALAQALTAGTIAGAALDVFDSEPLKMDSALLQAPHLILTPHLGASTEEAQTKVAEAIAKQFIAFFDKGQIQNAVNLKVHLDPDLASYGDLAERLGALAIQLADRRPISTITVHCQGKLAEANTRALAVCALAGALRKIVSTPVNLVNAANIAESRGIELIEQRTSHTGRFTNELTVELKTSDGCRRVSGTCFDKDTLRITQIDDLDVELKPSGTILVMRYEDRPGMVGKFGSILGDARINIAAMDVGRVVKGADAVVSLTVDDPVPEAVLETLRLAVQPKELHLVEL